jgi:hypothetical protein
MVDSVPPGTGPPLYQPLVGRIPAWKGEVLRDTLTSMSRLNLHSELTAIAVTTAIMVGRKMRSPPRP